MLFSHFVYSLYEWKRTRQEGSCSTEKAAGESWIPRGVDASGNTSESWCLSVMLERGILSLNQEPFCPPSAPPIYWTPLAIPTSVTCVVKTLAPSDIGLFVSLYRHLLVFPAMHIDWEIWNTTASILIKDNSWKEGSEFPRLCWDVITIFGDTLLFVCSCFPKCVNTYSCYIFLLVIYFCFWVYSHWSDSINPEGIKEDTPPVVFLVIFYSHIVPRKIEFSCESA